MGQLSVNKSWLHELAQPTFVFCQFFSRSNSKNGQQKQTTKNFARFHNHFLLIKGSNKGNASLNPALQPLGRWGETRWNNPHESLHGQRTTLAQSPASTRNLIRLNKFFTCRLNEGQSQEQSAMHSCWDCCVLYPSWVQEPALPTLPSPDAEWRPS